MSITILSGLYIVVGALSTAAHVMEFRAQRPALNELVWITVLGVAAIVAGAFMLRGRNWARWLALAWMAAHVVISAFNLMHGLVIHSVVFVLIGAILFGREARKYFIAT
ncbi:MAG: hypothetical protein WDM87_18655 [Terracidiphilus sp.]